MLVVAVECDYYEYVELNLTISKQSYPWRAEMRFIVCLYFTLFQLRILFPARPYVIVKQKTQLTVCGLPVNLLDALTTSSLTVMLQIDSSAPLLFFL